MKRKLFTSRFLLMCLLAFLFVCLLLGTGCGHKKEIENLTIDAEYACNHGKYEEAIGYYEQILEYDSENRTAIYGIKDIKEEMITKDKKVCDRIVNAICETMVNYKVVEIESYRIPLPGEYDLQAFLKGRGKEFGHAVLEDCLNVDSIDELSDEIEYFNDDNTLVKGGTFKVAVYEVSKKKLDICVFVSESVNNETVIAGGTEYLGEEGFEDKDLSFQEYTIKHGVDTMVGGVFEVYMKDSYFHDDEATYVGENGKKYKRISYTREKSGLPLNISSFFEVLKDDEDNYYYVLSSYFGTSSGNGNSYSMTLKCISSDTALRASDFFEFWGTDECFYLVPSRDNRAKRGK